MAQFIGTFQRKETKYVLDARQIEAFKQAISPRMQLDEYGATRIDSLYFDTPNRDIIARSIEKPRYKEKLRIRAYGDVTPQSPVFVEIKKKFKGIVYKRRVRMSRAGATAYLQGMDYAHAQLMYPVDGVFDEESVSGVHAQIARELDAFRQRYEGLRPSMVISCIREAWKPREESCADADVRITFDEDISYVDVADKPFDYDEAVAKEGYNFALAPGQAVLEIKCAGAYPLWLVDVLLACGIKPRSFSKYGTAYQLCCARRPVRVQRRAVREAAPAKESAPKRAWVFGLLNRKSPAVPAQYPASSWIGRHQAV